MTDQRYYRRVFRWRAEDSPNVRLALLQRKAGFADGPQDTKLLLPIPPNGRTPTEEVLIPGVLTWPEYCQRRLTWDIQRQTVGLDAMFYEGPEQLLFPPTWLARAGALIPGGPALAIGCDPGEGMADTAWSVVNESGLLELLTMKTPDTNVIVGTTFALMKKHGVPAHMVGFDRGGGGLQHADRMRAQGAKVRTVAFGESLILMPKHAQTLVAEKIEQREESTAYVNRRAEMFGELSELLNPAANPKGFAVPVVYNELRRQLSLMPKLYDAEGRLRMLPKNKATKGIVEPGEEGKDKNTLIGLIGRSPDEADSLAVAVWIMQNKQKPRRVGGLFR